MENQASVSLFDTKNPYERYKSMEKCALEHRQNVNNSVKIYFVYFVKCLLIAAVVAVLISIPWEFMHLYQKARAQKVSQVAQGMPSECNPENMTLFENLKWFLRNQFSWTDARSPCQEYYYALLVDPMWEVTPVRVLLSVIATCFLHPLEVTTGSLARCLRLFFSEIPAQWQPVLMIVAVIIVFVVLLMMCSYSLSIPLLLKLEPKRPVHRQTLNRSISYPNTTDNNGNYNKLECLPYSGAGSGKRCSLPSLFTTSLDHYNNHNVAEEGTQAFTESRRFTIAEGSIKNIQHAATTSSDFSSQQQKLFVRDSLKPAVSKRSNGSEEATKEVTTTILQFRKTVRVETSVVQQKSENINAQAKCLVQPKRRKIKVAKKKAKEADPLWTPDDDC